jgi:hypothetical protein
MDLRGNHEMLQLCPRTRRRARTKAVALILAWILAAAAVPPSFADDPPSAAKRPFGSLEKSLLVPGWGQLAEKRYAEGIAFLAAELACLGAALADNARGNEAYASYRAAASMDEAVAARARVEKYDTRRNKYLLAAAAVWAANLIDVFLIVKGKETKPKSLSLRIGLGPYEEIGLTAGVRF